MSEIVSDKPNAHDGSVYEIRDPLAARSHLLQAMWLARGVAAKPEHIANTLEWAFEIAASGAPLPPLGFICDVGHIVIAADRETVDHVQVPGFESTLARRYEDYVLGKLYADSAFERAADAVLQYTDRNRVRALAFLINQIRERANIPGVILSPGVLKAMMPPQKPTEMLAEGWELLESESLSNDLIDDYTQLITAVRNTGELLGPEDVLELQRGTALEQFGQRVALRQVWQAAAELEQGLPQQKVRATVRRHQVATRMMDEDTYPVGGFTSISNRGSIESLLHSQLAFMEPDDNDRPDLFDVKFLRDELLFYSRDENQFLRRRRTFMFVFQPSLAVARVKDAGMPYQRIVLLLALLQAAVRKLSDWLSTDALQFEFIFFTGKDIALKDEKRLLELMFRDEIAAGIVSVDTLSAGEFKARLKDHARRSLCHCLVMSKNATKLASEQAYIAHLLPRKAEALLSDSDGNLASPEGEEGLDYWQAMLLRLLEYWV